MRSKVFLIGAMVFLLSAGCAGAAGAGAAEVPNEGGQAGAAPTEAVQTLTLAQSQQIALQNSPDLKQAEIDVTAAWNAYQSADDTYDLGDNAHNYDLKVAWMRYVGPAKINYEIAVKNRELTKQQVALRVEENYYNLLKASSNAASARQALELGKQQLHNAEAAFNAGTGVKKDVIMAQALESSLEAALLAAENQEKLAMMDFNRVLGQPVETQVKLVDTIAAQQFTADLEAGVAQALANRTDILKAKDQLALQEEITKLIAGAYPGTYQAITEQANLDKARIGYEELKKSVEQEVRSAYYTAQNAAQQIAAAQSSVEQGREVLRITQLQYETGVATIVDVMKAQNDLTKYENQLNEAIYNYNLAVGKYKWSTEGFATGSSVVNAR